MILNIQSCAPQQENVPNECAIMFGSFNGVMEGSFPGSILKVWICSGQKAHEGLVFPDTIDCLVKEPAPFVVLQRVDVTGEEIQALPEAEIGSCSDGGERM